MEHHSINWKKYIFTFIITCTIFGTVIYASNYFGEKKLAEIKNIQDNIAIDILSSETQFALLESSSCKFIGSTTLSKELSSLEEKLSVTEKERGSDDTELQSIKRYYTLLQIKDYLLMKKISEKCKTQPVSIVYFYSNTGNCPDCEKQGYVLTKIREDYPEVRVYAFDYNLKLSALQTLISINKIKEQFPALLIDETTYYGFQSVEDLEKNIPELKTLKVSTSTPVVKAKK
jgi:glutaredoxin